MNWEQFTRRLRSELPTYSSEVDADAIWNAIEPTVDVINGGGKVIYKRLGLLLLLLITVGGGVAIYSGLNSQPNEMQSNVIVSEEASDVTDGSSNADLTTTANSETTKIDKQASQHEAAQSNEPSLEASSNQGNQLGGLVQKRTSKIAAPSVEHQDDLTDEAISAQNRSQRKKYSTLSKDNDGNSPNRKSPITAGNANTEGNSFIASAEKGQNFQPASDQSTWNRWAPKNGMNSNEVLMTSLTRQSSVMLTQNSQVGMTINNLINRGYKINPKTDCPSFKPKNFSFLLGVHGGASYPLRSITSTEDGSTLAASREDSESTMVSGNMGIDFLVRHRIGLEFGFGLQYLSMLERFDLQRTVTTTEMEFGVQAISINPLGDTTYITGMIPVTTTRTEQKRFYNKYKFTEIPITFGYSHEVKNWRIGGEASVILGILTKTEGKVLDENEEIVDLNADHPSVSGSSFGVSYYFGASLVHLFDSGFEMGLHPHARISPTDYSAADYSVRSKYVHVGLNVSVRYRFGR